MPTTILFVLVLGLHGYLYSFYYKFLYLFSFTKLDLNGLDSYSSLTLCEDGPKLFLMGLNEADALSPEDRSRFKLQNMSCLGHYVIGKVHKLHLYYE